MPTTSSKLMGKESKQKVLYQEPTRPKHEILYEQIDTSQPRDFQMGLIKDEPDPRDYQIKTLLQEENAFLDKSGPRKVDYREEMTQVKNQGQLGSCVSFAAAAVKEGQEGNEHIKEVRKGKKDHRKGRPYNLSEAWIYWNCKKIDPGPNQEGTSIRAAMKVLNKIGVPKEDAGPYTDDKSNTGKPENWSHLVAKGNKIREYRRITDGQDLKRTLAYHGPVVMGILVFPGFFSPNEGGSVPMPKNNEVPVGAHAICICGYNEGRRKLLFKNSGGTGGGDKGFGKLSFDYWHEGYVLDTWVPTDAKVELPDLEGEITELKS